MSNGIENDKLTLTYEGNTGEEANTYTAKVTDLGNKNYTLENAQNVTQTWYIVKENENLTLLEAGPVTYGDDLTLTLKIAPGTSSVRSMALAPDMVEFSVNGISLGSVDVTYDSAAKDSGTATLTVKAVSAKGFSAGTNAVTAEYSGNNNVDGGTAAITVIVNPKPITAKITGNTAKTYDGNTAATTGLVIELEDVEECDSGEVAAAADTFTYNSANVTEATTVTANAITLSGAQSGNYVLVKEPVTAPGKIEPKVVRLEWSGYEGLVYTGNPVNVTATATELIPGDECGVNVVNGNQINAGTYTAEAVSLTNSNYTLPDNGRTQEYTIAASDQNDPNDPSNPEAPNDPDNPDDPNKPTPSPKPGTSPQPSIFPKPDNPGDDTTKTPDSSQNTDDAPQTGDEGHICLWLILMLLSLAGIATTMSFQKIIGLFAPRGRHMR